MSGCLTGGGQMDDREIIELYHRRDENAISETKNKYEPYLMKIAYNILADTEDSKESVNDTYLKAWNSMPPHRPNYLSAFLAQLARRSSIDIFRKRTSGKRAGSEYALSLEELSECVSGTENPQNSIETGELISAVNSFLRSVSEEQRNIFIMRYYFFDSVKSIADRTGTGEAKIKTTLHRMRKNLKTYLEKEGFDI